MSMTSDHWRCIGPLWQTVRKLHSRGIIHRDIKPENILRDGNRLYIADFGLSVFEGEHAPRAGTMRYMSKEALSGEISQANDLYALGQTMVDAIGHEHFGCEEYQCPAHHNMNQSIAQLMDIDPDQRQRAVVQSDRLGYLKLQYQEHGISLPIIGTGCIRAPIIQYTDMMERSWLFQFLVNPEYITANYISEDDDLSDRWRICMQSHRDIEFANDIIWQYKRRTTSCMLHHQCVNDLVAVDRNSLYTSMIDHLALSNCYFISATICQVFLDIYTNITDELTDETA